MYDTVNDRVIQSEDIIIMVMDDPVQRPLLVVLSRINNWHALSLSHFANIRLHKQHLKVAFGYIKRPRKLPRKLLAIGQYCRQHGGDRFHLLWIIALARWRAHVLTWCMVAFSKISEIPPDQD